MVGIRKEHDRGTESLDDPSPYSQGGSPSSAAG
jgi:hypothetical protein